MALVVKDRVKETTTTTGTGALSLAGAVTNFIAFSAALSDGDTTYYAIVDNTNDDFEVGLGTYASAGNTLTRTTVLASSNAGSAVNLSAGTKDVFVTYPADKSVYLDGSGNLTLGGDLVVNGYDIKTAATGDLVLQAADVLQAKYNNGGSTALYANSVSGKIAIGSATVGSASITLDGSTTVTGAFTSNGIDDNADATAITIDSSERVGVGETSPSRKLQVTSAQSIVGTIKSTLANFPATLTFRDAGETISEGVRIGAEDNSCILQTNGTTRLSIDSVGTAQFQNAIEEQQYSLTGTAIDPSNGTIQYKTLGANTTFTESLADGEYVTLMIDDGAGYTITWPTTTWVGGSAPTLETSGYNIIELWHVNGTLYGAFIGAA